ncbi:dockerin type I domain-containing protein [Lacipirellula sp.]|uniref:dockerin type I domain-containing protein n=1 Tax=Lacipirellula sp. TaxID=2691419 RepID=UPI003D1195D8
MRRIFAWPLAAASFACAFSSLAPSPAQAVQINGLGFTDHTHSGFNVSPVIVESPFFAALRDTDASPRIDYLTVPAGGLIGSIKTPNHPSTTLSAGSSTTVSGRVTVNGNATSAGVDLIAGTADDWLDGNNLPTGVTLSYDVTFTISSGNGSNLVGTTGNTSNGLGIANGGANSGTLDTGEVLNFSAITTSNYQWGGAPSGAFTFTPISHGTTKFSSFRSFNFDESINEAVTLSDGTNTWGFGGAIGTVQSGIKMENDFSSTFTPAGGDVPLTMTMGAATSFGLKGFRLSVPVSYDIVANAPTINADFSGDGIVDGADFLIWQQNFGLASAAQQNQGDANGDGAVNDLDLTAWKDNFGAGIPAPPVSAVPEPATAALAVIAGLAAIACRKRR